MTQDVGCVEELNANNGVALLEALLGSPGETVVKYVSGAFSNIRLAISSQDGLTCKIKLSDKVIFDY